MKKSLSVFGMAASLFVISCGTAQKHEVRMDNTQDSLSYALGVSIAGNLKRQGIEDLNAQALAKGIEEAGQEGQLMDNEACEAFIQEQLMMQSAKKGEMQKAEGIAFLEENKGKEGVVTTASGLQYKVVTEGTGASPVATDEVTVHYHGTLITGEVFDSSVERGSPATFGLNQVIKGWTEGLQYMKEGGKTIFYIPEYLAYGSRATGSIQPYSTLIFEVELIKVN